MNIVEYFEGCGKFSIFGRIFLVLKVLAHEKSEEIQKIEIFNFHGMMMEPINLTYS